MITQLHHLLNPLLGQKIIQNDKVCVLIEIIDDGPLLVFQCLNSNGVKQKIQQDQHGNARRRSPPTFTIPCLNDLKTDLHPVLKELLSTDQQKQLLDQLL